MPHTFQQIHVAYPEKQIFSRLGANRHLLRLPDGQRAEISRKAQDFFSRFSPCGAYEILPIRNVTESSLFLLNGMELKSRDFARRCIGCTHLWCAASTIGANWENTKKQAATLLDQTICDAVGSETADAAMDQLENLARMELRRTGLSLQGQRFSPGYGDMPLSVQLLIAQLLPFQELGIHIQEPCYLQPEKSVTALCGIGSLSSAVTRN